LGLECLWISQTEIKTDEVLFVIRHHPVQCAIVKIAVIADTHGKLPAEVLRRLPEADEIWHLGDVCDPGTLAPLHALGKPVEVVRGNCDWNERWPMYLRLERGGKSFFLIHIPPKEPQGADFVLHGHTHVQRDEVVNGVRVLNPGTVGKPNKGAPPSYAWLEVDEKTGAVDWKLVMLSHQK
jgi:putative phosphoesterase